MNDDYTYIYSLLDKTLFCSTNENNITERLYHSAEIECATQQLRARKDIVALYFKNHEEEKSRLMIIADKVIQTAIAQGNHQLCQAAVALLEVVVDNKDYRQLNNLL